MTEKAAAEGRGRSFPFVRIAGQDEMKLALLLNVVDPSIGGVLITGQKGTAKSTTVRALEEILPERTVSKGCQFGCDVSNPENMCEICRAKLEAGTIEPVSKSMRVIELPLNATEDRVSGTLDVEYMLTHGEKKFEGGVLAQANGNILYVDEVNLLDDHVVDLLLDSAAMGRNYVEREGVSFTHPSRFILIGTMNPEEGSLRPQLLDRFGMAIEVGGMMDRKVRAQIVKERLRFDSDPVSYLESCREETEALRQRIANARTILGSVECPDHIVDLVVDISIEYGIEGHRADLAMMRAAIAYAALNGKTKVTKQDVEDTASLVLRHRLQKNIFEGSNFDNSTLIQCIFNHLE